MSLLLVMAGLLLGSEQEARRLSKEAQRAEKAGNVVLAYLLYSQAYAENPSNQEYWLRSQALRARAALAEKLTAPAAPAPSSPAKAEEFPQLEQALPPVELANSRERRNLDLRGDARSLFTQVATLYGLQAVFDSDYPPSSVITFRLSDADFREAMRALQAVTSSFIVPVNERVFLVLKESTQKRTEAEPVVTVTIPVPELVSLQDAQDLANAVRQAMVMQRVVLDTQRRVIAIRDRVSRVRPAQALIGQMLRQRAQVVITVEFLEVSRSSTTSYGAALHTLFPLLDFGKVWNSLSPTVPSGFANFLAFGGGSTFLGIGITGAELLGQASRSSNSSLYRTELRSLDGQEASLHVGERYPVLTGRYMGSTDTTATSVPPTINYSDLGLLVKVTPHVNGAEEVTLDLDAEFTALTGQFFDDVPQLSNRKLQTEVRLRMGEQAVISGLMNSSQARTITGLAGLSRIPILGPALSRNTRDDSRTDVLLVIQPQLVSLPPSEAPTQPVAVGSEQRPPYPL